MHLIQIKCIFVFWNLFKFTIKLSVKLKLIQENRSLRNPKFEDNSRYVLDKYLQISGVAIYKVQRIKRCKVINYLKNLSIYL